MMRIAIAVSALVPFFISTAHAAFTDFEDLAFTDTFSVGTIFQSQEITFEVVQLQAVSNPVQVGGGVGGLGKGLAVGPGVEFLLPANIGEVSLFYSDGAGSAIAINGVEPANPGVAGFSFLDGTSVAGVSIATTVFTDFTTFQEGLLTLSGPINTLAIAGLELTIDDVLVRVPEPATAALLLVASVIAAPRRRRRIC